MNYIQEELKLIDRQYFAIFNPRIRDRKSMSYGRGRWQIRKWTGVRPKRLDLAFCYGYSEIIFTVCQESVTNEGLVDVGYEALDRRVITAIRKSNYFKNKWKQKLAAMDWRNEKKRRFAEAELEYESRYAAKRIWRNLHEPTVHLSGKEGRV